MSSDQTVSTGTAETVCVPVGSSSKTTTFSPLSLMIDCIMESGFSGHSGGKRPNVSVNETRVIHLLILLFGYRIIELRNAGEHSVILRVFDVFSHRYDCLDVANIFVNLCVKT